MIIINFWLTVNDPQVLPLVTREVHSCSLVA